MVLSHKNQENGDKILFNQISVIKEVEIQNFDILLLKVGHHFRLELK